MVTCSSPGWKRWRVLALVGWIVLLAGSPASAQTPELELEVRLAARKLQQGDALGALFDLEKVIAADPSYWRAHFEKGRAQAQMGDDLGARASFQKATELDPGNAELHFLMATLSWQLADFDTAWEQAIASAQAGFDRGQVQQLMKAMKRYSPEPGDLQRRLAAPRVVVEPSERGEDAESRRRHAIASEIRDGLYRAPMVGLVKDAALARYRVEVAPIDGEDDPKDAAEAGSLAVRLLSVSGGKELYSTVIAGTADLEEASTRLQILDSVEQIEALLTGDTGSSSPE